MRAAEGLAGARYGMGSLRFLTADPRRAIADEHIVCLVCGRAMRQLTNTHLRLHAMTTGDYKARFGYNRGRPLMARTLLRVYAERAVRTGLADRIRLRPIVMQPELRRRGGARPITLEERLTRQDSRRATRTS